VLAERRHDGHERVGHRVDAVLGPPGRRGVEVRSRQLRGQADQQVDLVPEVDVETRPRDPRLGGDPLRVQLGELRATGQQALGRGEQVGLGRGRSPDGRGG
jgi:hypothetical protein